MPKIPTYQSNVQPRARIGVPLSSRTNVAERAEQQLAGTIAKAGHLLQRQADKRQDRLNTVMVSDAYAQLQKSSFDQLQAAGNLKGKEALNAFDDYKKWFDKEKQAISKGLQNDRQREIFSFETPRLQEARFGAVSRHQSREEGVYQTSVYNSNMALLEQEAVSQPFDDKVISNANARMMTLTAALHPGENSAAINMANDQRLQTLRVRAMIEKNPERAAGYIEKLKPRLGDKYFELKRFNQSAIDKAVGNRLYDEMKTANYAPNLDKEKTLSDEVQERNFDPFAPIVEPETIPDFDSARLTIENDKRLSDERKRQVTGWVNQDENKYIRLKNENEQAVFESARNSVADLLLNDDIQTAHQVIENSALPDWSKLGLKEFIQARDTSAPSTGNMVEALKAVDDEQIVNESEIKALKAINKLGTEQATAVTQYLKEKKSNDKFYLDRSIELFKKMFPSKEATADYQPDFEIWLREKVSSGVHGMEIYDEAKKYLAEAEKDWTLLNPFSWFGGEGSEFQQDIEKGEFAAQKQEAIPPEIRTKILQDIADTPGLSASPEVIDYVYQRKYKGSNGESN